MCGKCSRQLILRSSLLMLVSRSYQHLSGRERTVEHVTLEEASFPVAAVGDSEGGPEILMYVK